MKNILRVRLSWWDRWLLQVQSSPHKYKNETDFVRTNCLIAIFIAITPGYEKLLQLNDKFDANILEYQRARVHRDKDGKETYKQEPIFVDNQITKTKSKWWTYTTQLIVFGFADVYLAFQMAVIFMPKSSAFAQVILSLLIAFAAPMLIAFSFRAKQKYLQACDKLNKGISTNDLKMKKFWLILGYIFLAGTFISLIAGAVGRTYYFHNVDSKGMSEAMLHSRLLSSQFTAVSISVLMVITVYYLGYLKYKLS